MSPEFYVGYQSKAPPALGRWLGRTVFLLCLAAVGIAGLLVFAQQQFAPSWFEYGIARDFEGTFQSRPYPSLIIGPARYLLVAPGKHGAETEGLSQGVKVRLRGSLIHRGQGQMIEMEPGAIQQKGTGVLPEFQDEGEVTLRGEIVDTKCYFGVMNPGTGKVHRDCAVRCLSGGIPPGFLVRDQNGALRVLVLTGLSKLELLGKVAEPVTISGKLTKSGSTLFLDAASGNNSSK